MNKLYDIPLQKESSRVPGEWVKELFAPIYSFDDIVTAGKDGYKSNESKIPRVPILDPQTVREVFERVHQRVVEAEELRLQEIQEKSETREEQQIDPRKSSIWNTEELNTLRKVYKSAKGEITKLEVALREQTARCKHLETTVQNQREEITSLREHVAEATKANNRLVIHRDSLQKDNSVLNLKCAALKDAWIEIGTEKQKAMEKTKEVNLEMDRERLLRQKLEADLSEAMQNLIREKTLIERNITTKFEMEVNDLNEVIRDLTVQLQNEKRLHEASKRGLDHLRKHFSSLPLDHILPHAEDQVDHIDHCSL